MVATKAGQSSEILLRLFPADLAYLLVEFNKHIASLDADYIVIMARKALRLYDLLLMAGGPFAHAPVLSHHVLDQDLRKFVGKKVCLIDDTLILGTTLGEAERRLAQSGANVSCHVFAVDDENWCDQLVVPEKIFARLNHESIRSFCAMEVNALSATGIPYLSDFPVSETTRLSASQLMILHSLPGWDTHTLTTAIHANAGVAVYTLLPKRDTEEHFRNLLGPLSDLLEITKIRAFCTKIENSYWTRYVPIVTLGPVRESDVANIFDQFIIRLEGQASRKLNRLREYLTSPLSQLRFVQYVLSLVVGNVCLTEIAEAASQRRPTRFEISEAARLFGPWLQAEFQTVHATIPLAFSREVRAKGFRIPSPRKVQLPESVVEISKAEFEEFVRRPANARESTSAIAPNHYTDLVRAFIGLYRRYEPPARAEARRLGKRLFEATPSEAPFRDRLKYGFAWRALAESLLGREGLTVTRRRSNRISLILDHLIDMGIAVPVLCHRDGILFRGYRYGEDVEFGDEEIALAYETISSFLTASRRNALGGVVLEKLLASLLHIGVAKRFLRVVSHGLSGVDGIARIGFHLHGAMVTRPRYDTIFADEQDTWLSGYLVERAALTYQSGIAQPYQLGVRPEAAFPETASVNEARQLGLLLGTLFNAKDKTGATIFDTSDLIVLTACPQPRYALAAIAAELRFFVQWFDTAGRRFLRNVEFGSKSSLQSALDGLIRENGSTAINSARLKLEGYKTEDAKRIVDRCLVYLKELPSGDFLASQWESDWAPVLAGASDEQRSRFEPWITAIATDMLCVAVATFTMEIALASALTELSSEAHTRLLHNACTKASSYIQAISPYAELDDEQKSALSALREIAALATPIMKPKDAFDTANNWLRTNCARMRAVTVQAEVVINEFGRQDKRVKYHSVLWYDVIDSKGDKSQLVGPALVEYRNRVRAFKDTIFRDLTGIAFQARSMKAIVFPFQGRIESKDDEKHIFVTGPKSVTLIQQITKMLIMRAHAHRICVRAVAARTNFAGEPGAYKFETTPDPEGDVFWEHFSVLRTKIKVIEVNTNINRVGKVPVRSFFWVAGELIGNIPLPRDFVSPRQKHEIKTEIENIAVSTDVVGGPVNWPRKQQ